MTEESYEGLPPDVRRKVQEADRKLAEIKQADTQTGDAQAQTHAAPTAVVPDPSAPSTDEPESEPDRQAAAPQGEAIPPTPDANPTLTAEDAKKLERMEREKPRADWKDRYAALLGKYNADVPRLHDEIKSLKAFIGDLQTRIDAAQAPAVAQATANNGSAPQSADTSAKRYVTDKDIETFGPEFADTPTEIGQHRAA